MLARDEGAGHGQCRKKRQKNNAKGNVSRRRGRDRDYDNAEATAVQPGRAAVSTEGDEAGARTGAAAHATMTGKVAMTGTQRKQSCMQTCVESKQVIIEYIKLRGLIGLIETRKFVCSAYRSRSNLSTLNIEGQPVKTVA